MVYYLIIRGPLGCGKSTVAEALSGILRAKHVAIDNILDENNIEEWEDGYVSKKSFIKANEIIAPKAGIFLQKGTPIVFDGNFYWKSQIDDLIKRLDFPHHVFTLRAPLEVCIERDRLREKTHGEDATRAVYKKSTEFDYGTIININRPLEKCIEDIISYLGR